MCNCLGMLLQQKASAAEGADGPPTMTVKLLNANIDKYVHPARVETKKGFSVSCHVGGGWYDESLDALSV